MKEKIVYSAFDGTEFDDRLKCENYEINKTFYFYDNKGVRLFPGNFFYDDLENSVSYIKIVSNDLTQIEEVLNDYFPDSLFADMILQNEFDSLSNQLWKYDEYSDSWVSLQDYVNEIEKIYKDLLFDIT